MLPNQELPNSVDDFVDQIQSWISSHTTAFRERPSDMKTSEFLDSCRSAGAHVRVSNDGRWIVRGPSGQSIKISGSTRQLAGMVVKKYLQTLGLSESLGGIRFDEFREGLSQEQELVMRLQRVLRRLAHV